MTPESRIRNIICSWLTAKKAFIFIHDSVGIYDPKIKRFRRNTNPYRKIGVSDILGIWQKKFLAIECKAGKNKPTPAQEHFIREVNEKGGIAFVAYSLDDVIKELDARQQAIL